MKKEPIVSIKNLRKTFKGDVGVKGINFNVYEGEIFGFLGPNGAGKSTTIKMMLDIIRPDNGEVEVFGQSIINNSIEIRSNCGYLPGDFNAFDGLTGKEFLNISSKLKKKTYEIESLLSHFQLDPKALARKVKTYSQGMKQKLGLINAIAGYPKLLILDEPSAGLDPIIQHKLYQILKELSSKGITVLFSSHNLPEVEKICDRVAVIKEGKIVVISTLDELRKNSFRTMNLSLNSAPKELKIDGAKLLNQENNQFTFLIESDINTVIKQLQKFDIKDISIPEPSLEEIFKSFYESNN